MATPAADGLNWDGGQESAARASGVATQLKQVVPGHAGPPASPSRVLAADGLIVPIVSALAFYLAGWAVLSAGIVDRYARQRPTRAHGFFAVAGGYLFRFIRLGALVGLVYWWLFAYVHRWLFDRL